MVCWRALAVVAADDDDGFGFVSGSRAAGNGERSALHGSLWWRMRGETISRKCSARRMAFPRSHCRFRGTTDIAGPATGSPPSRGRMSAIRRNDLLRCATYRLTGSQDRILFGLVVIIWRIATLIAGFVERPGRTLKIIANQQQISSSGRRAEFAASDCNGPRAAATDELVGDIFGGLSLSFNSSKTLLKIALPL